MAYNTNRNKKSSDFKKVEFIDLSVGQHTIRFLDDSNTALDVDTHFINGATVLCLGDDCPACKVNRELYLKEGKDAKNNPAYHTRRQVFYWNVFDKTPVKVCQKCGHENKKVGNNWIPTCQKCGEVLTVKDQPLNKIKVLNKGVQFADLLNGYEVSILDTEMNPLDTKSYDYMIMVDSTKKATPAPMPHLNQPLVLTEEQVKYDLPNVPMKVSADEMRSLLRGVSLRDIFNARKAESAVDTSLETRQAEVSAELEESLEDLFGKE